MPGMALGTTTIENIVAHDAAALEKDLASIRADTPVSLPGVPQIVTRLQQMLSDPEVGIPQLVPVINYEPVLVGRVLQMANSASLNPTRRQITDLRTGVTRVGFDLLRSAALAYALRQVSQAHSVKDIRPHLEALWERSAWIAAVSFVIARKFTRVNRDIAFLAGLMHGVGKLFILTRAAHYPFVLRDRAKYGALLRKWHTPFAKGILTGWRIHEDVVQAVVQYENLNREVVGDDPDLTDILATSYLVVGHVGRMQDLSMTVEKIAAFSRLRLDIMAVEETLEKAKEEIEDLRLAIK
ncbi:MAG TPA: HDOD domain-containing protein [Steroidobacteraceae bacterium]|nr:HDOD domain-containing protein [Steroidobacteraceae bacterium]